MNISSLGMNISSHGTTTAILTHNILGMRLNSNKGERDDQLCSKPLLTTYILNRQKNSNLLEGCGLSTPVYVHSSSLEVKATHSKD